MNSDAMKSLFIKIVVAGLTAIAAHLHITAGVGDTAALATDLVDAAFVLYGVYRSYNMKLVPHDAKIVGALLLAVMVFSLFAPRADAADNLPLKFPAFAGVSTCTPQNCSGGYLGFGVAGDGSNADIVGNGINGSVFSSGGALKVQGGYQFWSGAWFAALDLSAGYEFTTATSAGIPTAGGSKFLGTELIKLGYNFFPASSTALTTPSQSPVAMTVATNILSSSTPYFNFGGMQRRGVTEWVNGAGVQTVIAAGWSSDVSYLYAPSQQGVPAASIVTLGLNKHF